MGSLRMLVLSMIMVSVFFVWTENKSDRLASGEKEIELVKDELVYKIRYESRGSRSERKIGLLSYRSQKIPYLFNYIQYKDSAYKLTNAKRRWGNVGYQPTIKKEIEKSSEKAVNDGAPFALTKVKFADIPDDWAYVEWENGSAFIDLNRFNEIITMLPFKDLPVLFGIKALKR